MSQLDLAEVASVGVATVRRFEAAETKFEAPRILSGRFSRLWSAGVEFIPEEAGKGPGVRLRQARDSWR